MFKNDKKEWPMGDLGYGPSISVRVEGSMGYRRAVLVMTVGGETNGSAEMSTELDYIGSRGDDKAIKDLIKILEEVRTYINEGKDQP